MGQRHQIFVRIPNPAKNIQYLSDAERKKLYKEFGKAETTILSFHNQWLYGRSALQQCMNLLSFAKQIDNKTKLDKDAWGCYDSPITVKGQQTNFNSADKIINAIKFILNFRPTDKPWLASGIGGTFYLDENELREDFTGGDNNDGITIIDTITNKYCFMNIYSQDKEATHGISSLPSLLPLTAHQYVSAYYGETIETTNPYYFERIKGVTTEKKQKVVNSNIKTNKIALKGFEKFEVLTLAEIQKMFKKMNLIPKKVKA
jgi:hypothetical protein